MKTRVLFIVPSLARAGAETQLVELVNGLDQARVEKHLLVFESCLDQLPRLKRDEVTFHHAPRRGRFDLSVGTEIARVIDAARIDVVHCTLQIALAMGWLARRRAHRRTRLMATLHTTRNRDLKSELFDYVVYQWLMRDCERIICVCETQREHWSRKFPFTRARSVVVYNGVDTIAFERATHAAAGAQWRATQGIDPDAIVLAHIAAFRPEKGQALLLDAYAKARKAGLDAWLVYAGDGVLRARIERAAAERGLSDRVRFLGGVSDVRPLLAGTDISVLPSRAETFSMAMLESLAMGVPVVGSDVGGIREAVLHERTGLVVPSGNPAALADALLRLTRDGALRRSMGEQGRRLVRARFSRERMLAEMDRLLTGSNATPGFGTP